MERADDDRPARDEKKEGRAEEGDGEEGKRKKQRKNDDEEAGKGGADVDKCVSSSRL